MSASTNRVAVDQPYALSKANDANYVEGRRSFLQYRELGATGGRLRCQITEGKEGLSEPTGWHYHVCDAQFVYILNGWVDLEFAGGDKIRIEAGNSLVIPGGTPHNETAPRANSSCWRSRFRPIWARKSVTRPKVEPAVTDISARIAGGRPSRRRIVICRLREGPYQCGRAPANVARGMTRR